MTQLLIERLKFSLRRQYLSHNFFRPFWVKGVVNKRTKEKTHLWTDIPLSDNRALYFDIVTSYSTKEFLVTLWKFSSLQGIPEKVYSDCGSKLVTAEKELRDAFQGFFKTIFLSMEMIKLSNGYL